MFEKRELSVTEREKKQIAKDRLRLELEQQIKNNKLKKELERTWAKSYGSNDSGFNSFLSRTASQTQITQISNYFDSSPLSPQAHQQKTCRSLQVILNKQKTCTNK